MLPTGMRVSLVMVQALADAVGEFGVGRDELASASQLPRSVFESPDGYVDEGDFARLSEQAVRITGDEAFGLHWAERALVAPFHLVGHLTAVAATFGEAVKTVARLLPLLVVGAEVKLRVQGDSAVLEYRFDGASARARHAREEFVLAASTRILRFLAGPKGVPESVHFSYPRPAHHPEYARVFGGAERFAQPFIGLVFDRGLLETRSPYHDADIEADLRARAEARLRELEGTPSYAARVRASLRDRPVTERVEMNEAATRLGISVRSLRRHLAREEKSFPELRREALAARATALLSSPERSIKEVAHAMGFADPAAFRRAFRRWTGMTAKSFRARTAPRAGRED
jgi:AraC-like DNA-binding protein